MTNQKEYKIAKGFIRIAEAHEEILRQGYGWQANVPDSEAIARAISLRESGYEVATCRPTFKSDGCEAKNEAALFVRKR